MQAGSERNGSIRCIQQAPNALGELRRVAAINQNAVLVVADDLRHTANASGDDGQAEHAGFQQYDPEWLRERTQAEKSCRRVQCSNLCVRYIEQKKYALLQTEQ